MEFQFEVGDKLNWDVATTCLLPRFLVCAHTHAHAHAHTYADRCTGADACHTWRQRQISSYTYRNLDTVWKINTHVEIKCRHTIVELDMQQTCTADARHTPANPHSQVKCNNPHVQTAHTRLLPSRFQIFWSSYMYDYTVFWFEAFLRAPLLEWGCKPEVKTVTKIITESKDSVAGFPVLL